MKITSVTVRASGTFPNPYRQFSNIQPSVTLEAELDEGESSADIVGELQGRANAMLMEHKESMLGCIQDEIEEGRRAFDDARRAAARSDDLDEEDEEDEDFDDEDIVGALDLDDEEDADGI